MSDPLQVLHEQQARSYEKYTYFLLATAGAAVAFAIQRTGDSTLTWLKLPLAGAVGCWAASFWCGIARLNLVEVVRSGNFELLKRQKANQPVDGIKGQMDEASRRASWHWNAQFNLIAAGAAMFVVWHVLEMASRTYAALKP